MKHLYLSVQTSPCLQGIVPVFGAKNAALVIIASLILTQGKSTLLNVPGSADIFCMIELLEELGAQVTYSVDNHILTVDTTMIHAWSVSSAITNRMRASILAMGPLLARFGYADVALPGGCVIGERPIDFHLKNMAKMGVQIEREHCLVRARSGGRLHGTRLVLEYPSVGATENLLLAAVRAQGTTSIINAAFEPEVFDLITVLRLMGAAIELAYPNTIHIQGVSELKPINYTIMPDRLEMGSILLAAAVTGGSVHIPAVTADILDVFLLKLEEMGHQIIGENGGISIHATDAPKAVSFKTGPYPSFPTDLQAPMMLAQCLAHGKSIIEETVYENRLLHVRALRSMGANIVVEGTKATVIGVRQLQANHIEATDIRASCALVIAGLAARGTTTITGAYHWIRGYEKLEKRLGAIGARIALCDPGQPYQATVAPLSSISS